MIRELIRRKYRTDALEDHEEPIASNESMESAFLDADTGVSIDKCVEYNRFLYKKIEEAGLFPPGDFTLEVSSPGTDEPLRLHRQYLKNRGRNVEVTLLDGSRKEGKLVEVSEDGIILEEHKGNKKKKEVQMHTLLFDNIKSTKIQVVF